MKNRLLATLLTLVAVPFFATATTTQQPTKGELLAHLKNSHDDILENLRYISMIEKELPKFVGKENILFLSELINDIHTVLPLPNFLFGKNIDLLQLYFEKVCEMKQFYDIENEIYSDYESLISTNIHNKKAIEIENEIKLILPIFIKHHKSYCSQHPNGFYKELCINDILNDFDSREMFVLQTNKHIFNNLLQKIDTKIAELEAQL